MTGANSFLTLDIFFATLHIWLFLTHEFHTTRRGEVNVEASVVAREADAHLSTVL